MAGKSFTASKTRSKRPGWSVIFPHPLKTDTRGIRGAKVRRGLGTTDDATAERLVAEVNELLHEEAWWNPDRRSDAESRFDPIVVAAFFDGSEAASFDSEAKREEVISLPGHAEGYSTVMLVGTTGAGKTTLLRHLIGSDPNRDRFPSTSTAKTTTADIEIVTAYDGYHAAITFMPEQEVRAHIDECIEAACIEAVKRKSENKIAAALLEHREQRFRLSYLLGEWPHADGYVDDDFKFGDEQEISEELDESDAITDEELKRAHSTLFSFVKRIQALTNDADEAIAKVLNSLEGQETADDRSSWLELFSIEAFKHPDFSVLALDIMDEISERFMRIEEGDLQRSSTEWPLFWTIFSEDREQFLSAVRWFSSNHHRQFGRLLTPLVNGIRVSGPFAPQLPGAEAAPRLVLLDGEGLGHNATAASSISTRITNRFGRVDMILLIDNAEQPMQAAPISLLRVVGSSGFARKIAMAFTHFDQVDGPNLGTFEQKRNHVLYSVRNAVADLRNIVGAGVADTIEAQFDQKTVFLGGLNGNSAKLPKGFKLELSRLIDLMQHAIDPAKKSTCKPIFEFKGIEIAMLNAIASFRKPWQARLGIIDHEHVRKEHWARLRALARRLANRWGRDEYDNLTPIADLLAHLQDETSKWLDRPSGWTTPPKNNEERELALDAVREAVFGKLLILVKSRLKDEQLSDWRAAYEFSGTGSSGKRSDTIESIYNIAAPHMNAAMSPEARDFLDKLYDILREAILEVGGQIR